MGSVETSCWLVVGEVMISLEGGAPLHWHEQFIEFFSYKVCFVSLFV